MRSALRGLLAGGGCAGGPDADAGTCLDADIVVECGTALDTGGFSPLHNGDPIPIVHLPAGGWGVPLAVRVEHGQPLVALVPTVADESRGGLLLSWDSVPLWVALDYDERTCAGDSAATDLFSFLRSDVLGVELTPLETICQIGGDTLTLRIDLLELQPDTYTYGRAASCEVEGVATLDPADVSLCP